MANFVSYIILVLGLSLLLGLAGVHTGIGSFMNAFVTVTPQNATSNFSVNTAPLQWQNSSISGSLTTILTWDTANGKPLLLLFYAILATLVTALAIRTIAGGTFGVPETIKTIAAVAVLGFMISDMGALLNYVDTISAWGGAVKIIAWIIYLPVTVSMVFAAFDWIGGGK